MKPAQPNSHDGLFFDSYGNQVKHGTEITIESNYNNVEHNNRPAVVEWDKAHGMYTFRFIDGLKKIALGRDFCGIIKFKVIKNE